MGFVDLFKPKWKHSDPDVRAEAVRQTDDAGILGRVAAEDPDPRLRKLAIKRLDDPTALATLAEKETDEALRKLASERANVLLLEQAISDVDEEAALAALDKLFGERVVAEVARRAKLDSVRRRALGRLVDQKALADVARRAENVDMRKLATEQILSPALLREVALNETDKEVALVALAKLDEAKSLKAIARHAKNKAVRLAASERLETPSSSAPESEGEPDPDAMRRTARIHLVRTVEAALKNEDLEQAARDVGAARQAWEGLGNDPNIERYRKRFEKACQQFASRHAARPPDANELEETQRIERQHEERQRREQEEATRAADEARAAEEALRRAEAEEQRRAEERAAKETAATANLTRVEELCQSLEALAQTEDLKLAERTLKIAQDGMQSAGPLPREAQGAKDRFAAARQALRARIDELRDTERWKRWANVPRLAELCARVEALTGETDLKKAAEALRAAQAEWKTIGPAPKEQSDELRARFKQACDFVHQKCQAHLKSQRDERLTRDAEASAAAALRVSVEPLAEAHAAGDAPSTPATPPPTVPATPRPEPAPAAPQTEVDAGWAELLDEK